MAGDYITEAMLEARHNGAAKLAGFVQHPAGSTAYSAAVLDIIERAEEVANGYLKPRYDVPVPAGAMIEGICLDLAELEIYRMGSGNVPEKIQKARDEAIELLKAINSGTVDLGGTTAATTSGEVGLTTDGADGLFDSDSMEDANW